MTTRHRFTETNRQDEALGTTVSGVSLNHFQILDSGAPRRPTADPFNDLITSLVGKKVLDSKRRASLCGRRAREVGY